MAIAVSSLYLQKAYTKTNHISPVIEINKIFRQEYALLRENIQRQSRPVIFQSGNSLYLERSNGYSQEATAVGPLYDKLKSISHIPFTAYIMLKPYVDNKIPAETIRNLRNYKNLLLQVNNTLTEHDFSEIQLERQQRIIKNSNNIINKAIKEQTIDNVLLTTFTRQQTGLIKLNLAEVVDGQITTMHKQLNAWRKEIGEEEWQTMKFIVGGSHMARVGSTSLQYFTALRNRKYDGKYQQEEIMHSDFSVIYAESVHKKSAALKLVATHILDEEAGHYFFDDNQRMHRDILADEAEKSIKRLFKL